jgi:surface antigen
VPLQSHRYQRSLQALATLLAGLLLVLALPAESGLAAQTDAGATATVTLCQGFDSCQSRGYSHQGYKTAKSKMYWNMYSGVNCTNYVAYRMIQNGGSATRPAQLKAGKGNAEYWGPSFGYNQTPMVGSIAWWKANVPGAGSAGHVAYVEQVVSATEIVISESNYGSEFSWRRITKSSGPWPSGFIHYKDVALTATAAPAISGAAKVGVALRATSGTWTPTGSYAYQWFAGGAAVAGATATTFTPTAAQLGKAIQVRVTASRASYVAGASTSAATAATAAGTQTVVTNPAITGTAQVDQTLTVSTGAYTPKPTSVAIQWLADGVPIPGAKAATFKPTQDLANKRLSATVTTATAGYTTLTTTTAPTGPVLAPDITVAEPGGVEGKLLVGAQLTADPGVLEPHDAQATYVWMRDGQPMPAFTARTYVVKPLDIGRRISVRVQLTHTGYRSKALVLGPVGGVKAPTSLRLKFANGRAGEAWVKVIVRSPDSRQPSGQVWVKLQGKRHLVRLQRGVGKIRVTGLRPGRPALVALYMGDARTTRVRSTARVTVTGTRTTKKHAKH